jgi:hypothetical protein
MHDQSVLFLNEFSVLPPEMRLPQKLWEAKRSRNDRYDFLVPMISYKSYKPPAVAHQEAQTIQIHEVHDQACPHKRQVVFNLAGNFLVVFVRRGRNGCVLEILALAEFDDSLGKVNDASFRESNRLTVYIDSFLAQSAWCQKRRSGSVLLDVLTKWLCGDIASTHPMFCFMLSLPCLPCLEISLNVYALRSAQSFYLKRGFIQNPQYMSVLDNCTAGGHMTMCIDRRVSGKMSIH